MSHFKVSKIILIVSFLLLILNDTLVAQIKFESGDWATVQAKAKAANKPIMVDAYTTWCGPCKWMQSNVFSDKEVGKFFNANFISFKMDMERGEGIDFATRYDISAYPTIVYFSPDGDMISKTVGASDVEVFIEQGNNALDPNKQVFRLIKEYKAGNTSAELLRNLVLALVDMNDEGAHEVATKYWASQPQDTWKSKENTDFMLKTKDFLPEPVLKYVADNKDYFEGVLGTAVLNELFASSILKKIEVLLASGSDEGLASLEAEIRQMIPDEAEYTIALLKTYVYASDPEKSFGYMKAFLDNHALTWEEFNTAAWGIYENETDINKLQTALHWADKSIAFEKNWYNTDTKANLLFKLGRLDEALKVAIESVSIGKNSDEDTYETELLVEKIKEAQNQKK